MLNVCRLAFFEAVLLEEPGHALGKGFAVGSSGTINAMEEATAPAPAAGLTSSMAPDITLTDSAHSYPLSSVI